MFARLVDVPGYGNVTSYEHYQHHHEGAGVDVDDSRVPLHPQGGLELHAVVDVPAGGVAVGQDQVGQRQERHHHPHAGGQDLGEGDAVHPRVPEGLHDFQVAVDADEPQEHDGGVHVGVEQHRGVAAQEGVEVPWPQLRVLDYLERERQCHEKVCDHDVFEVKYETRFISDVEKNPDCEAVEQDAGQEDDEVKHGQDDGGELVVRGVPERARRGVGRRAVVWAQAIICRNEGKQQL